MKILNLVEEERLPQRETIAEVSFSAPSDFEEIESIVLGLEKLCNEAGGIGISAVQAGIPKKLFLVREIGWPQNNCRSNSKYGCYLNCSYEPVSDEKFTHIEGCLSLHHSGSDELRLYRVDRYTHVQINGYVLRDNAVEKLENFIVHDFPAAVFQHEIDHSFAILISDIGKPIPRRF